MSEQFFAEATVRLTPDLTGFVTQLRTEVKAAVERVEGTPAARVRIAPALTRDFVGNLRKQVNLAVAQAQRGVKPIQVRAVLSDTSRAAIAREVRAGAQTVRTPSGLTGAAALGSAAVGAAAASGDLTKASVGLMNLERLMQTEMGKSATILGQVTVAQEALSKARVEGSQATRQGITAEVQDEHATAALTRAKTALAEAQLFSASSSLQAARFRSAESEAVAAIAAATRSGDVATRQAAEAFRIQLRTIPGVAAALDETSRSARQAASNMSQLRRGVLSTSLSFLGIRGATLAASARFLAGAAAIAIFAKALQSATEFSTQLNVFRATTSATSSELERARDAARALGADLSLPGVTAQDAAEAMTELAKAGLSVDDALSGARGVLQLATAAAIDNAQATELAANAINAFGLAGRDATHVADVFANAANAAQGSIVDMGIAFQQASAAGRQVGLSFEDTTTFLTVLARNGLRGSDAGTSLRTALIRLVKPSKAAAEELKRLGVETRDAAGNLRPDIFIQIAEATRGMAPAQRDATAALIGGQDAFRAITILGRQSIEDFIRLRRELREQGTAADLAAARMTGLRGSLERLSNTLTSIGLRAGQRLTPALQQITDGLSASVVNFGDSTLAANTFSSAVDALELSLTALGASISAVGVVLGPLVTGTATVANAIGIPTILAGIVAYKGLGLALTGIDIARTGRIARGLEILRLQIGLLRLEGAAGGARAFASALGGLAFSTAGVTIALAAAAAAIVYIVTRETAAEKATRKLKEATEGLVSAQERLAQTRTERRSTGLGINTAELGVLNAQRAVAEARAASRASSAAEGSFERRKLALELAVALDNVAIAQNAVNDAVERSKAASDEAAQAETNLETARADQIEALARMVATETALTTIRGRRNKSPGVEQRIEAAAIRETAAELQKRAQAAREEGSAESIAVARRLELLATVSAAVKEIPTTRAIEITVLAPNLQAALNRLEIEFETTTDKIKEQLFSALTTLGQSPEITAAILDLANELGIELVPALEHEGHLGGTRLVEGIAAGIDENTPKVLSAVDRLLRATKGRLSGLERQALDLSIAGASDAAILANLQQQRVEQQKRVNTQEARFRRGEVSEETVRREKEELDRIIREIRSLQAQMASDAKSAADDAKSKQDEIFENILKAMGIKRDRRQQAIEDAQLTEGSADDLSATRKLRRLVNVQIARLQERINAARKQGQSVQVLIQGLRVLEGLYRDLGRTVISLQKTRQEEIQARIAENNQLDIEFAQITENRAAEIRARLREIARLKRLQKLAKDDILERKRLRNLIAQQQKAIEDLRKQNDDRNRAFQELSFSFLTTQQGFAANLLGNLLPLGAIGSTVAGNLAAQASGGGNAGSDLMGGGTGRFQGRPGMGGNNTWPPGRAIAAAAATSAAGVVAAPTRGQASTTNQLLQQILAVLRHSNQRDKHPSSKRKQGQASAALDGMGGGA